MATNTHMFSSHCAFIQNTFTNDVSAYRKFPLLRTNTILLSELNAARFQFSTTNVVYNPSIPNCNKPLTF